LFGKYGFGNDERQLYEITRVQYNKHYNTTNSTIQQTVQHNKQYNTINSTTQQTVQYNKQYNTTNSTMQQTVQLKDVCTKMSTDKRCAQMMIQHQQHLL
jgi:hypothetical protein